MKQMKIQILIVLLFILVGIAAVTTNLTFNINTPISSNQDDFFVYFSDAKIDGITDLKLVKNEQELFFSAELTALGDKKVISYDVTNASKNYDARISITCTGSNDYLKVTNLFDEKNDLTARSTRSGTLMVELINAVSIESTYEVKCIISASAIERNNIGEGEVSSPLKKFFYDVGDEVVIQDEKFYVISDNGDTITMLAQYNLDVNYKQKVDATNTSFSDGYGWSTSPGPQEIDIQQYSGAAKTYINEYVSYLTSVTGDSNISGTLITLKQLKALGCSISEDYSSMTGLTCANSEHVEWLVIDNGWWTRSAVTNEGNKVWYLLPEGVITNGKYTYADSRGIRPVITIDKAVL